MLESIRRWCTSGSVILYSVHVCVCDTELELGVTSYSCN